jgi:ubiquinone/menaquinone biosynthesis C-methylase UbiE
MIDVLVRQKFLEEYRRIRHAEGRGSDRSSYYRSLPHCDPGDRNEAMWQMRAKTYSHFICKVLQPIEEREQRPLDILDLGAGNCWLSYRLARRRHLPVAVDFFADNLDGLGAARHYPISFQTIESDFDEIPVPSASFDLAIFNASLHYSTDYMRTLTEAKRCLRPAGSIVILDSPIYNRFEDGARMVKEKHERFFQLYGFRSDTLPSIDFLDIPGLRYLELALNICWQAHKPWYGWRWHLRPLHAKFLSRRPPSRFWVLVGNDASGSLVPRTAPTERRAKQADHNRHREPTQTNRFRRSQKPLCLIQSTTMFSE